MYEIYSRYAICHFTVGTRFIASEEKYAGKTLKKSQPEDCDLKLSENHFSCLYLPVGRHSQHINSVWQVPSFHSKD